MTSHSLLGIKAGCNVRAWLKLFAVWSLGRLQRRSNNASGIVRVGLDEAQTIPIFEEPLRLLLTWIPRLHLGFLDQNLLVLSPQWVYHWTDESMAQIASCHNSLPLKWLKAITQQW